MKARKSNDSWSDPLSKGLRPSLRQMQRSEKGAHRRFIFSVSLFIFTIAGLIIGGTGSFMYDASAQESTRSQSRSQSNSRFEWMWNNNTNSRNTQMQESRTTAPTTQRTNERQQAPAPTQQQAPSNAKPAPTPVQSQAQAPATTQSRTPAQTTGSQPQAVIQNEEAAPVVDTAADIETMATAQASTEAKPVTYTSNQISTESRNRLLALAVSALTSGSLIFIMSLFGSTSTSPSVARYRKLGREVLAS